MEDLDRELGSANFNKTVYVYERLKYVKHVLKVDNQGPD